jgi:hypothetical protein
MPNARFNFAVGVLNDTLYALGGAPFFNVQGNAIAANELYIPFGYEGPLPPSWSPAPSSSPSPTISPTPVPPSTPTPTPLEPTETPSSHPEPFPTTLVAAASVTTVAAIGIGLLIHFKKRKP